VLKQFAALLRKNTRAADVCCRYGGEEMCIILPETDLDEAVLLANKLCSRVRTHVFLGLENQSLSVTTSVGVTAYTPLFRDPTAMVQAADTALYQAKELGRNRVVVAGL